MRFGLHRAGLNFVDLGFGLNGFGRCRVNDGLNVIWLGFRRSLLDDRCLGRCGLDRYFFSCRFGFWLGLSGSLFRCRLLVGRGSRSVNFGFLSGSGLASRRLLVPAHGCRGSASVLVEHNEIQELIAADILFTEIISLDALLSGPLGNVFFEEFLGVLGRTIFAVVVDHEAHLPACSLGGKSYSQRHSCGSSQGDGKGCRQSHGSNSKAL